MRLLTKASLLLIALPLCLVVNAQAASFNCEKAASPAEKLVCANPVVSKLDDDLEAVYRETLARANEAEKQVIITHQKHWIKHTRDICRQEVCFKHAYWSRQAELAATFEPSSPLYTKESDKAATIQQILLTTPLYEASMPNRPLCRQILSDLKQMKEIRFVDPVVQTMSYEDTALDPWKKRFCSKGRPLGFSYECEPRFSGDDIDFAMDECYAYYGLPPYKIFELPALNPSDKPRYFFYFDRTYGPTNRGWTSPNNKPSIAFWATFKEFRYGHCDGFVRGKLVTGEGKVNYNSIVEYKHRYFILMLQYHSEEYGLNIEPIDKNESCSWTTIKN